MPVQFCSLIRKTAQVIPPGEYTLVRFPFGSLESWDNKGMHNMLQPDGYQITKWDNDDRSALIWPHRRGLGRITATMQFESGNYTELRHQLIRDPLNLSTGPDTTGTEHLPPSPGMQCFDYSWEIIVNPGTPLGYRVSHNATSSKKLVLSQFKLSIYDLDE
jgi:hypothetical protein